MLEVWCEMNLSDDKSCNIPKIVKFFIYSSLALGALIVFYTVPSALPDYRDIRADQNASEFRTVVYKSHKYSQMQISHSSIHHYHLTEDFAGIRLHIQDWIVDCLNDSCEEYFCLRLKGFVHYNPEEACGPLKGYTDRNWNSMGMKILELHVGTPNSQLRAKWVIQVSQISEKSLGRLIQVRDKGNNDRKRRNVFMDIEEKQEDSLILETPVIVNGFDTDITKVPWQASIRDMRKPTLYSRYRNCTSSMGRHFCGGSIVSNKFILSAAHCFISWSEFRSVASLRVVVGDSFSCFTSNEDTKIEHHEIETVYVHYGFDNGNFVNDLVIIKLKEPVQFSENVKAVKLSSGGNLTGKTVYLSGWGRTNYSSPSSFSNVLQYGKLVIASDETCDQVIPKVSNRKLTSFYNNSTLCGRAEFDNSMAGKGDSGGGLYTESEDHSEEPNLIGVTSYILNEYNMSYFQSVAYFKDWIRLAFYF